MVARAMMTRMARRRRRGSAGRFTLINISSVCKRGKPLGRTTPPLPVLACASSTLRRGAAWFADQSCVRRPPQAFAFGLFQTYVSFRIWCALHSGYPEPLHIPFPFCQPQVSLAISAPATPLAGREDGLDRFKPAPGPRLFVPQLAQKVIVHKARTTKLAVQRLARFRVRVEPALDG
jgi:hypothetical protein